MHAQDRVGVLDEGACAPQRLVEGVLGAGRLRQLCAEAAVEDDAARRGDRLDDATVGGDPLL
jgi:hypothetical protein